LESTDKRRGKVTLGVEEDEDAKKEEEKKRANLLLLSLPLFCC